MHAAGGLHQLTNMHTQECAHFAGTLPPQGSEAARLRAFTRGCEGWAQHYPGDL